MKTLLLMRHAKSSWKEPKLDDRYRPLNKRGRSDAPLMGQLLFERELVPERILSSSALRSRQTADLVAESARFIGSVTYLDALYMAEAEDVIGVLHDLPDDLERVLVVGHNPGLEALLQELSGKIESLPTAVIAHLVLPVESWSSVRLNTEGECFEIWHPKDLRTERVEKPIEESKKKDKKKEKKKGK